jgi:rhomboid family GlyGly-CTERM serine protease
LKSPVAAHVAAGDATYLKNKGAFMIKDALSSSKVTLGWTLALLLCNAGFLTGAASGPWFQTLCAWLQFDRAAIFRGEFWRLFTGHLVHWSPAHFYLDALVFAAQGIIFEQKIGRRYGGMLVASAGAIGLALLLFQNELVLYRGISGLINTQLVLGAGLFVFDPKLRKSLKIIYCAVFGIHLFKIAYETAFKVPFLATDAMGDMGSFTPLAHLSGVLIGMVFLAFEKIEGDLTFESAA